MSDKHYTLHAYIFDALMRDLVGHDHRASAFLVYLALTTTSEKASNLSLAQLAERTGLSKRSVQDSIRHLIDRNLLRVTKRGATEIPRYEPMTPWRRRRSSNQEPMA